MDLRRIQNGGGGRIRTFEGVSRQIYSLLPLAARAPLHADVRAERRADSRDQVRAADPAAPNPAPGCDLPATRRRSGGGPAELAKGLEPPTTSLQMRCSTS